MPRLKYILDVFDKHDYVNYRICKNHVSPNYIGELEFTMPKLWNLIELLKSNDKPTKVIKYNNKWFVIRKFKTFYLIGRVLE